MRTLGLLSLSLLFTIFSIQAQSRQELSLEPFENVELEGNIRLYVEYGDTPKVALEAKKSYYLDEYKVEVRNNTLYVSHREHWDDFDSTHKIEMYLEHPGIQDLDMEGLVSVYFRDTMRSESLRVRGEGYIRGELDIIVDRLYVGLDGLSNMSVVGRANDTDIRVDGMGKIDARGLQTKRMSQSTDGLANIKVKR